MWPPAASFGLEVEAELRAHPVPYWGYWESPLLLGCLLPSIPVTVFSARAGFGPWKSAITLKVLCDVGGGTPKNGAVLRRVLSARQFWGLGCGVINARGIWGPQR